MKLIMTKLLYCNSLVPTYCKMSVKMCARCSSGTQNQFTWHSRQDSVCLIVYMYKHHSTALKKKWPPTHLNCMYSFFYIFIIALVPPSFL